MKKILFALLIALPSFCYSQTPYPGTGSPQGLNYYKGGLRIDSFFKVPERPPTQWDTFGLYSDIIRQDSLLYWFNSADSSYHQIGSDADGLHWSDTLDNIATKTYANTFSVSNIDSLMSYSGKATTLIVKDSLRGGIFNKSTTGTVDSGVVFPALDSTYWVRQYNPNNGVSPEWFGAIGDGTSNDKMAFYKIFSSKYEIINLKPGAIYNLHPDSLNPASAPGDLLTSADKNLFINGNGATIKNSYMRGRYTTASKYIFSVNNVIFDNSDLKATSSGTGIFINVPNNNNPQYRKGGGFVMQNCTYIGPATYIRSFKIWSDNVIIKNCRFDGPDATNIELWGGNNILIDNNTFTRTNSDDNIVFKSAFEGSIDMGERHSSDLSNITISNNYFDGGYSFFSMGTQLSQGKIDNLKIIGNYGNVTHALAVKPIGNQSSVGLSKYIFRHLDGIISNAIIANCTIDNSPGPNSTSQFNGLIRVDLGGGSIIKGLDVHDCKVIGRMSDNSTFNYSGYLMSTTLDYSSLTITTAESISANIGDTITASFNSTNLGDIKTNLSSDSTYTPIYASIADSAVVTGYWRILSVGDLVGTTRDVELKRITRDSLAAYYDKSDIQWKNFIPEGTGQSIDSGGIFVFGYIPRMRGISFNNISLEDTYNGLAEDTANGIYGQPILATNRVLTFPDFLALKNKDTIKIGRILLNDTARRDIFQDTNFIAVDTFVLPVNNGTLTLSTGTGLSGSQIFTANQSGNDTFNVGIASGYTLPTTTQVSTWNNKQDALSGTGFVKASGSMISYDSSTYFPILSGDFNTYKANTFGIYTKVPPNNPGTPIGNGVGDFYIFSTTETNGAQFAVQNNNDAMWLRSITPTSFGDWVDVITNNDTIPASNVSGLSDVATTGSYQDLIDTPTTRIYDSVDYYFTDTTATLQGVSIPIDTTGNYHYIVSLTAKTAAAAQNGVPYIDSMVIGGGQLKFDVVFSSTILPGSIYDIFVVGIKEEE